MDTGKTKEQRLLEARARADALGVKYHHKAGPDTIEAAVNARLVELEGLKHPNEFAMEQQGNGKAAAQAPEYEPPLTEAEYQKILRSEDARYAGALVRCRIQNMNPEKKNWRGEFISVGSSKLGTFKKFIPFGTGEPYHIPRIIYNELKEKKFSQFFNEIDNKGRTLRKSKLIPEYVVDVLPPLTEAELKELARKQAMARGQEA